MTKLVINTCYGGFGLSHEAILEYLKLKGKEVYCYKDGQVLHDLHDALDMYLVEYYTSEEPTNSNYFSEYEIPRDDLDLITVVESLGSRSFGPYSELKIVEIPDDVEWEVNDYDGVEWVAEKHRIWR